MMELTPFQLILSSVFSIVYSTQSIQRVFDSRPPAVISKSDTDFEPLTSVAELLKYDGPCLAVPTLSQCFKLNVTVDAAAQKPVGIVPRSMSCPSAVSSIIGSVSCLEKFSNEIIGDDSYTYEMFLADGCEYKIKFDCAKSFKPVDLIVSDSPTVLTDGDLNTVWAREIIPGQSTEITIDLLQIYQVYGIVLTMETVPIELSIAFSVGREPRRTILSHSLSNLSDCPADSPCLVQGEFKQNQLSLRLTPPNSLLNDLHSNRTMFADKVYVTLPGRTTFGVYFTNFHIIRDIKLLASCACHYKHGVCSMPTTANPASMKAGYACLCDSFSSGFLCDMCSVQSFSNQGVCVSCGCGSGAKYSSCTQDGVCECDPYKAPAKDLWDKKCQIPYVTSVHPTAGIVGGDTKITVTGGFLSQLALNLTCMNDCQTSECLPRDQNMTCQVPSAPTPDTKRLFVARNALGQDQEFLFSHVDAPSIENITPNNAFVSGGRQITVIGTKLDGPSECKLTFSLVCGSNPARTVEGEACVTESPRRMLCRSANFSKVLHSCQDYVAGSVIDVKLGLRIDGVDAFTYLNSSEFNRSQLESFRVVPDPVVSIWEKLLLKTPRLNEQTRVRGTGLDSGATIDDYTVKIDGVTLEKISLNSTMLLLKLPSSKPSGDTIVTVGNIEKYVGDLVYDDSIIAAYVLGPVLGVLLVVLIAVCVVRHLRKPVPLLQKNINPFASSSDPRYMHKTGHVILGDGSLGSLAVDQDLIGNLKKWLIAKERLSLLTVLGQGQFGRVYKGMMKMDGDTFQAVAVKTLTVNHAELTSEIVNGFLQEATLMSNFNHANVLGLVGVICEDGTVPVVILPFMEKGDLKKVLQDPNEALSLGDILHFSLQLARGMDYLARMKFVHRDLAARNCMVNTSYVVKIADFGLSHDIYEADYYRSDESSAKPLPVKWMAIESLLTGRYTSQSDVWSFGVLMWELFTRGASPYPGVNNFEVKSYLVQGDRLSKPDYCSDIIFSIMQRCWLKEPHDRPNFAQLSEELQSFLDVGKYEPRQKTKEIKKDYYLAPTSKRASYTELLP